MAGAATAATSVSELLTPAPIQNSVLASWCVTSAFCTVACARPTSLNTARNASRPVTMPTRP